MTKTICIYSSSSKTVDDKYKAIARDLGRAIADQGWQMVFGGGLQGLMGESARGIHDKKGYVIGVIPEKIHGPDITYMDADELVITESMDERKRIMDDRADAFIALPGGIGTLEEIIETLTLKQLGYHDRPVLFFNAYGFYDKLFAFFDHLIEEDCYKHEHQRLYTVVETVEDAIRAITDYNTPNVPSKFD